MSFFKRAARDYLLYRIAGGGRHRRRRQGFGHGHGWGHGRPRHRRGRSNVRVTGCCLPIPLGVVATAAVGGRSIARRRR